MTTGKVEILESAKKEAGLQYHHRITIIVEKHKIPINRVFDNKRRSNTVKIYSSWTFYHVATRCKNSWRGRNCR